MGRHIVTIIPSNWARNLIVSLRKQHWRTNNLYFAKGKFSMLGDFLQEIRTPLFSISFIKAKKLVFILATKTSEKRLLQAFQNSWSNWVNVMTMFSLVTFG
jgi:hypothetical protein